MISEEDDPVHESALDWSVSGISSVSEFDPNQFTRENAPTPDLTSIGRDEIDQLVDNVRDIRNSLHLDFIKTVVSQKCLMHLTIK